MVYTVTLNPSLDYTITIDGFALGRTNRTVTEQIFPGGKGINVSMVLSELGIENVALGFLAGFTGDEIRRRTEILGLRTDFIKAAKGLSRINVKMKDFEGTEINGKGPKIGEEELELLLWELDGLKPGDVLVLSGSIPEGVPSDIYARIMERLSGQAAGCCISQEWAGRESGDGMSEGGIRFVVDASGEALKSVLPYHPFLIKPNLHELGELFGKELRTKEEVVSHAGKLKEQGAVNVLVSMGGEGAVLLDEHGDVHQMRAPAGRLVNAVGAGDSMVAGFLAGWMQEDRIKGGDWEQYERAFRMGVAAGSAAAFSEGLATKERISNCYINDKIIPQV